jgi:hypothetical protein
VSAAILQSAVAGLAGSVIVGAVIGAGVGVLTEAALGVLAELTATGAILVAAGSEALQLVLGCSSTSLGASCGEYRWEVTMDSWPSRFISVYTLTAELASSVAKVWRNPWTSAPRARSASMPGDETRATPYISGCLGRSAHRRHPRTTAPPVGDFDEEASPGSLVKFGIDVMPVVRCECRCDQMCTA